MKSFRILIIGCLLALFSLSCQKEIVYDENPFLIKKRPLDFKELSTNKPAVTIHQEALLFAKASGDELSFSWQSLEGTLVTSDSIATFSHSETGFFSIQCTVTDKYGNSQTKEVSIQVSPELIFTGIWASEPAIPVNFSTELKAIVSGLGLQYQWQTSGGELVTDGETATFTAIQPGTYVISCTVSDELDAVATQTIEITVVNGFIFKSLTAEPDRINAGDISNLTAHTLGNDLEYKWRCDPPANILGSGSKVAFSICHADVFQVFCEVTDKSGYTEIKSVIITVN